MGAKERDSGRFGGGPHTGKEEGRGDVRWGVGFLRSGVGEGVWVATRNLYDYLFWRVWTSLTFRQAVGSAIKPCHKDSTSS